MASGDPRAWTEFEVAAWIRTGLPAFAGTVSNAKLPDLERLAACIQDQEVDGPTLLSEVGHDFLKECGISALGRRAFVLRAIESLRTASSPVVGLPGNPPDTSNPPTAGVDGREPILVSGADESSPASLAHESQSRPSVSSDQNKRRANETIVIDTLGRKRRKLNLTATTDEPAEAQDTAETAVTVALGRLPDAGHTLDMFAYRNIKIGQVVPEDEGDSDEFTIMPTDSIHIHSGTRQYIQSQMRHLFTSAEVRTVKHDGRTFQALVPYRKSLLADGTNQSVSLFLGDAPADPVIRFTEQGAVGGEWDFLLQKTDGGEDDKICPLFGESEAGSEISSGFERELVEEEDQRNKAVSKNLTRDQVDSVVKHVIEDYRLDWEHKSRPKFENNHAAKVWRKARAPGQTGQIYKTAIKDAVTRYEARLRSLCDELVKDGWRNEIKLIHQCVALHPTIESIEEARWKVSVWRRPIAPDKPPRRTKLQPAKHQTATSPPMSEMHFVETGGGHSDMEIVDLDAAAGPDLSSTSLHATADIDDDDALLPPDGHIKTDFPSSPPSLPDMEHQMASSTAQNPIEISSDEAPIYQKKKTKLRQPELATWDDIMGWDIDTLASSMDRKRLMTRMIATLDERVRLSMENELEAHEPALSWLQDAVRSSLERPPPSSPLNGDNIATNVQRFVKLYACWITCNQNSWDDRLPSSLSEQVDGQSLFEWAKYVANELPRLNGMLRLGETIELPSDVSDSDVPKRARRKRAKPDERTANTQKEAIVRMTQFNVASQHASNPEHMSLPGSEDIQEQILINVMKAKDDSPIYLNRDLAKRVKNHQIEGIKFMWREACLPEAEGGQGCVLAHTMGLGKTCQAIAFLVTLKEASDNPDTRKLIPKELRPLRALILVPPAILENWVRELRQWSPHSRFFNIFRIDSTGNDKRERLDVLRDWKQQDGILIMGYQMFQSFIKVGRGDRDISTEPEATEADGLEISSTINSTMRKKRSNQLTKEEAAEASKILLEHPGLVIADEAHYLKNHASKIFEAVRRFRTKHRIALTGTPMSNQTGEIFSLIDWAAQRYLGTIQQFRDDFAIPIEEGMYHDSSVYERRKSIKRLAVLKQRIEPKIHRADITALKGSLPTKTEYNIRIPLTPLQEELYTMFITAIKANGKSGEAAQVRIFGWLATLGLLCIHPKAFRNKLLEGEKKTTRKARKSAAATITDETDPCIIAEDVSDDAVFGDESVKNLGISEQAIQEFLALIPEKPSVHLSYRMLMLKRILRLCKRSNEKVLVFSHSLPALDCIEELVDKMKFRYERIDGSINMAKRDAILSQFREGRYDLMLISTRAGGQGLNMQDASRVIIMDFGFNPSWEEQAVGRAYRLGQKKPVFVYRFVTAGTYEDRLYNTSLFKSSLFLRVVDKKNPQRHAMKNVKDWLFPPAPAEQDDDIEAEAGKDPKVLDVLIEKQRNGEDCYIRAIKTTETLQREAEDEPLNDEERLEVEQEAADWAAGRYRPSTRIGTGPSHGVSSLPAAAIPQQSSTSIGPYASLFAPYATSASQQPPDRSSGMHSNGGSRSVSAATHLNAHSHSAIEPLRQSFSSWTGQGLDAALAQVRGHMQSQNQPAAQRVPPSTAPASARPASYPVSPGAVLQFASRSSQARDLPASVHGSPHF